MKTLYKILIAISVIALAIIVITLGVKFVFWVLYLILKYPIYFAVPIVLFIIMLYISKQFKTK